MKVVVITGSNRGIGFGLAQAFLARGCAVVVSGRQPDNVAEAVKQLQAADAAFPVFGIPCDVTNFEQVQHLWDQAIAHFGQVDIWINNAGISGGSRLLWEQTPQTAHAVINTNLVGAIYGTQVAMAGMLKQGFGAIYSMEGMGSDGTIREQWTLYGMSKYGLKYFNDAVAKEAKSTPILIGALRPGMVVTDFLVSPYRGQPEEWDKVKNIFNIIAEPVEVVTPWLADRILANQKSGVRINRGSMIRLLLRFLTARITKRDVFKDIEI
ncbi:MAG: SDR family oxidoreductase [Anaerolineae bacterium]|nr:SDR family oxidoreductase [Anaerolineae bacterium]